MAPRDRTATDPGAVARLSDIAPGSMLLVSVGDRPVLIVNVSGTIHALDGLCTHEDEPLDEGFILGDEITCGLHGSRFRITTGEVLDLPAERRLTTYAVRIEGEDIFIDALSADPGLPIDGPTR